MTDEDRLDELLSGPDLYQSREWLEIDRVFLTSEYPGIIAKMEVGSHDLYLKTAWKDGRIIRIDITLSRGKDNYNGLPVSARQVGVEASRFDLARSWIESECRMASNLLQTGKAGIGTIIKEWLGVAGFPCGYCPQLPGIDPETGESGPTYQIGPLHAAAMLIKSRLVDWTEGKCDVDS